ncbi:type I-E CRISPR-associated protein Cse2/CasB [Erwinia endophytica]|uniref:type I-E CRISPR-associated protein Cse2/CasB n=1 Tax=Erwinia endophytica TaxID=1563158 RepID=UPI001265F021|nr:type I-E CRISPR-associated protein Cse2/CasB [Erwinia endophytica]KAB8306226.1 type I-E CRISPR-associated protein Cse2/CasB [Erwinia endophytica]
MERTIDAMALYNAWSDLDKGSKAKLRRADTPDKLMEIPVFYLLAGQFGWPEQRYALQRMIFCLAAGVIKHSDDKDLSLGKALAKNEKISMQRIIQLIRQESPNDMVQLRRLLNHAEPVLHWPSLAKQLQWWSKYDRRTVMEDFVLSFSKK